MENTIQRGHRASLYVLCKAGDINMLNEYLQQNGVNSEVGTENIWREYFSDGLSVAIHYGHLQIVKRLIELGTPVYVDHLYDAKNWAGENKYGVEIYRTIFNHGKGPYPPSYFENPPVLVEGSWTDEELTRGGIGEEGAI